MILLKITDIKSAMAHLLVRGSFDTFYLDSADVTTFVNLSMRGRRNRMWYDSDVQEENGSLSELVRWEEIKSMIFSFIKGDRTPTTMKIALKADDEWAENMLKTSGLAGKYLEQKPDLFVHFRYEQNRLCVVTGISYRQFTMDKQIEFAWDEAVRQYFRQLGIAFF